MARKYPTEYGVSKVAEILKTEGAFRQDVDLRLDVLERGIADLGSESNALVARVVRAIETEIAPRAAEIEALLADYRDGVPAERVQEEPDGRQFLTPERRSAILSELRGGVAGDYDTLAKLIAWVTTALMAKAPLASPALTGTPSAPTAAAGTSTGQIATTAFVTAAIAALKGGAPAAYDTLVEIAAWIAADETAEAAILSAIAQRLRLDAAGAYTSAQQRQGRVNLAIGSARDARRNRIVNGGLQWSQERGDTATNTHGSYPADQFGFLCGNDGIVEVRRVVSRTPGGSPYRLRATVAAADPAIGPNQYACIETAIEGQEVADFLWGTAGARPAVLRFGVRAPAGTYGLRIVSGGIDRTFIAPFAVTAGGADQVVTIPIPGDVAGTWPGDIGVGMRLQWMMAAGSAYFGVAGWQPGNLLSTPAQSNLLATVGNVFELFDVGLHLDPDGSGLAPPWELPDPTHELRRCQRYWWVNPTVFGVFQTSTRFLTSLQLPNMRVAPMQSIIAPTGAVTIPDIGAYNATGLGAAPMYNGGDSRGVQLVINTSGGAVGPGTLAGAAVAFNARLT